jgi:mannose-6-phosphate isomerase-like protein (cupin superfamily)
VRFRERPGTQDVTYYFGCLNYLLTARRLSALRADFEDVPVEKPKPHLHAGVEFLYVIKGSLVTKIGREEFLLEADGSVYFDPAVMHSYRRRGNKPCVVP